VQKKSRKKKKISHHERYDGTKPKRATEPTTNGSGRVHEREDNASLHEN
jgi:hypothetical protein